MLRCFANRQSSSNYRNHQVWAVALNEFSGRVGETNLSPRPTLDQRNLGEYHSFILSMR